MTEKNRRLPSHALLGASGAQRWLACPPSARLCEALAERLGQDSTSAAREGTKAHALAELKLRYALWKADGMTAVKKKALSEEERESYAGISAAQRDRLRKALAASCGEIPADMDKATDSYCQTVMERYGRAKAADPAARLLVEQRLDYSRWAPEGFGTADALIVSRSQLDVLDYKHGRGFAVSAEGNPQTRLYALGALARFGEAYRIAAVRCAIVQPRLGRLSEEYLTAEQLLDWAENEVAEKARLAWRGEGEYRSGGHCRHCPARPVCFRRFLEMLCLFRGKYGEGDAPPAALSEEQVGALLPALDAAEDWIGGLREYAERRALHGQKYPGYKLVRGRRPNRRWDDEAEARERLLRCGYEAAQFEETRLRSVGDVEKAVGRETFRALLGGLVTQGEGRVQLAPESDPRPEWSVESHD